MRLHKWLSVPITQSHKNQRGVVNYMFAVALPILCGMAALTVDLGAMWQTKRQLQNCADAAALAGAWELGDVNSARDYVLSYLASQGADCSNGTAPIVSPIDRNQDGIADALQVVVAKTNPSYFSQVIGEDNATVGASAIAGKVTPTSFLSVEPFGLQVDAGQACNRADVTRYTMNGKPLTYGETYTIKYSASSVDSNSPGNFQPLALGGTGSDNYRENVANGYPGWLSSCDGETTEPGNKVGPTIQGLDSRMLHMPAFTEQCEAILDGAPARLNLCPRVLTIAIIPPLQNGRSDTQILSFAWLYLLDYHSTGNSSAELTGILLDVADMHAPPGEWKGGSIWDPSSSFPAAVKLIE